MSYLVLARKWRPQSFEDVTGQEHVVRTLANAIAQDRVAHAFLLCGPRGVGKTTTARLLARALNCESGPTAEPCGSCTPCREIVAGSSVDVVEIDGASNNGVDNIRELRETARYLPQRDRHKIFIIDEVHMLSTGAFNALLKTLEEPPAHVKFVFATTDPQKLPDTILSRCQRHNFRRVPAAKMIGRLRDICEGEGIEISDRALGLLARQADGGMRDALSLLDALISSAGLQIEDAAVEEALGLVDRTVVIEICDALLARDGKRVIEELSRVYDRGVDAKRLCEELAQQLRDLIYVKAVGAPPEDRGDVEQRLLTEQAARADAAQLSRLFDLVHGAIRELGFAAQPRLALEVALLNAVHLAPAAGLAELAARLEALAGGAAPAAVASNAGGQGGGAGAQGAGTAAGAGAPLAGARAPASPPRSAPAAAAPVSPEDLVRQVEALARGRAAPRQTGSRPGSRGAVPGAGSDDEPHGARPSRPPPTDLRAFAEGLGAKAPSRPSAEAARGGPGSAQRSPAGMSQEASRYRSADAEAREGTNGDGAARRPAFDPAARAGDRTGGREGGSPFRAGDRTGGREGGSPFRAGDPTGGREEGSPFRAGDRPGGREAGSSARPPMGRSSAPVEATPWGDDEPPPPGDEDAPFFDDDSAAPIARPLKVDSFPGGCATNECTTGPIESGDDPTLDMHTRWRRAVETVRRQSPVVGTCLSEGRLLWLRPGEVGLGYTPKNAFHRTQLAGTDTGKSAEALLTEYFGHAMRLSLQQTEDDGPASVADEERKAREERAKRLRSEARENPAVLAALQILGGEIEAIEVLEEG